MNTLACLLVAAIVSCVTATNHGGWDTKNEKVGFGGKYTSQSGIYGSSGFQQSGGLGDYKTGGFGHQDSGLGLKDGQKDLFVQVGSGSGHKYGGLGQHNSGLGLRDERYGQNVGSSVQFGTGSGHKYGGLGQYDTGYGQRDGSSVQFGTGSGHKYGGLGQYDGGYGQKDASVQFSTGSLHKNGRLGQYHQQSGFGKQGGFIVEPKKDVKLTGYLHAGHHH